MSANGRRNGVGGEASRLGFDIQETAAALGLGRGTVRELIENRRLKAIRVGRRLVIPRTAIEAFLEGADDVA